MMEVSHSRCMRPCHVPATVDQLAEVGNSWSRANSGRWSRVTSRSINRPRSSHRKYKLFSPKKGSVLPSPASIWIISWENNSRYVHAKKIDGGIMYLTVDHGRTEKAKKSLNEITGENDIEGYV